MCFVLVYILLPGMGDILRYTARIPANFTFLRNVWHTAAAVTAAGGTLRELPLYTTYL
jgi:hypothetical protein